MGALIKTFELYRATNGAITQNSNITSDVVELEKVGVDGYFSLHMIITGGTVKAEVLVCSTPGGTFVAPSNAVTIVASAAAGTHFYEFNPPAAPFMKIKFTELNVGAVTAMDAWLNVQ